LRKQKRKACGTGLRLFVDAFCRRGIPIDSLKVWSLARYWDSESGSGACVWDSEKAGRLLGVKASTAERYLLRAKRNGFLRVVAPQADGRYYVRYCSAAEVSKRWAFDIGVAVSAPLGLLKSVRGKIAVILSAVYGQHRAYCAALGRTDGRRVLKPLSLMKRADRLSINVEDQIANANCDANCQAPVDEVRAHVRPLDTFEYRHRGRLWRGRLVDLRLTRLRVGRGSEFSGNILPTVLRHEAYGSRKYALVDGRRCYPYSVGQQWIAQRAGVTQPQVSKYLREFEHYQVRVLVGCPGEVFQELRQHPDFDPEQPTMTNISVAAANDRLEPGLYLLHRLDGLFNLQGDHSNEFVLTRDVGSVYNFPDSYRVVRSWSPFPSKRKSKGTLLDHYRNKRRARTKAMRAVNWTQVREVLSRLNEQNDSMWLWVDSLREARRDMEEPACEPPKRPTRIAKAEFRKRRAEIEKYWRQECEAFQFWMDAIRAHSDESDDPANHYGQGMGTELAIEPTQTAIYNHKSVSTTLSEDSAGSKSGISSNKLPQTDGGGGCAATPIGDTNYPKLASANLSQVKLTETDVSLTRRDGRLTVNNDLFSDDLFRDKFSVYSISPAPRGFVP